MHIPEMKDSHKCNLVLLEHQFGSEEDNYSFVASVDTCNNRSYTDNNFAFLRWTLGKEHRVDKESMVYMEKKDAVRMWDTKSTRRNDPYLAIDSVPFGWIDRILVADNHPRLLFEHYETPSRTLIPLDLNLFYRLHRRLNDDPRNNPNESEKETFRDFLLI